MRKIHGVLLGMFAGGVLLGGIGTGIAFGEYSGMEYGGTVLIGEENLVTEELDYAFTPEEGVRVHLGYCPWGDARKRTLVVEDLSVPEGIVRYEVTYNSRELKPELITWEMENEEEEEAEPEAGDAESQETESASEAETESGVKTESEPEPVVTFVELRSRYQGNEFELMMELKDRVLGDIKKGKLSSYESVGIADVAIRVNPKTVPYLEDETK